MRLFGIPIGKERHSLDKMKVWGEGGSPEDPSYSGMAVSQETALRLTVVWRCIRLISETLAALPIDIVRKRGEVREPVARPPSWAETPNPEQTWFQFAERVFESLAMDGNAFIAITSVDAMGFPQELWVLHPRLIQVKSENGLTYFLWGPTNQRLSRYGPADLTGDVLHIALATAGGSRGMSPLEQARQAIGLGLVTEKFGARFFGRGQQMSGVIQLPASQPNLSREHISLMRETWEAEHSGSDKAHRAGILTGGATWQAVSITNEDAQFLETRKFQVEEICRWFGVPPHMVGSVDRSTSWGTGIEQQSLGFVRFVLMPWIVRLEQGLSQLTPRGQFAKFNQRSLLRADTQSEAAAIVTLTNNGIMLREEARALLDLPPKPGTDKFLIPVNEKMLDPNGEPPAPPPQLNPPDQKALPDAVASGE